MKKNLTTGSIFGNIMSFALPYMLTYFLQILYGLADLFVIGQYCGVDSTTAVSNGAQVMYMFTVVIIGLAMGTTVRTARAVGARDKKLVSAVIGNTFTLFVLASVLLSGVMLCLRGGIVAIIDTPPEAVEGTMQYLTVCFAGIPFIVVYNVISSIFRGLGDTRSPMYFVAVACVVNILLDYLFIGFMHLGPVGAALGTTLSQMTSVVLALIAMRRHRNILDVKRHDFKLKWPVVKSVLTIGVPVALQDGCIQVAFMAIMVIANGRGIDDAAAVGIVEKFIGLLFIVPSAMLSTVSAVAAQNIGAGNIARAQATLRQAIYITVGFGAVVSVAFHCVPHWAVGIFTGDANVVTLGSEYLRSYVIDCFFAGIHFCFSGFFTAMGYSVISFLHNIFSMMAFRIPLSYILSKNYPDTLYPMGFASPTGSLVSALICIAVYWWMSGNGKLKKPH